MDSSGKAVNTVVTKDLDSSRKLFSRDTNYLRDVALVWPFILSSMVGASALYSPEFRQLGIRCLALAIVSILLVKERLLMFFAALGFVTIQVALTLGTHGWSWSSFAVLVVTGIPFLLANRYWREPKLSYRLPSEFGAVDMLLSFASICGTFFVFYLIRTRQ
jgi:hypothetical protein